MSKQLANPLIGKAVNKVLVDRVLADVFLDKPLETRIRQNFNTACWTFNKDQHFIFIGDQVLPYDRQKPNLSDQEKMGLYEALMHHELAHATWTSRNFKLMQGMCDSVKADFSLLNLMEDCRIEQKHRDTFGAKLNWLDFVESPVEDNGSPTALLFKMIEAETADVESTHTKMLERVKEYHARIIEATGTAQLRPIMKDWMEEFSQQMEQEKQQKQQQKNQELKDGQGQGNGQPQSGSPQDEKKDAKAGTQNMLSDRDELSTGNTLANDDAALAEAMAESKSAQECAAEAGTPGKGKKPAKEKDAAAIQMPAKGLQLNLKEVDEVAALLEKMMTSNERMVSTSDPTNRLNRRAMLNRDLPGYRAKVLPKKKKLKISLIVDCSGSMQGDPERNAVVLTAALHLLALKGFVEGQVIISTTTAHEVHSFSDEKSVSRVFARSTGEGLERTMGETQNLLRDSDAILVFTDGELADNPIDKKRWHGKGITTVGLYTGSMEHHEYLDKYFDKSLIRPNIKELAHALQKSFSKNSPTQSRGR